MAENIYKLTAYGGDDEMEASQARLEAVLAEYPVMRPMYGALRIFPHASEDDWIAAARAIHDEEIDFGEVAGTDKNIAVKYRFIQAAGIADNPGIPKALKQRMMAIIFEEEDK